MSHQSGFRSCGHFSSAPFTGMTSSMVEEPGPAPLPAARGGSKLEG